VTTGSDSRWRRSPGHTTGTPAKRIQKIKFIKLDFRISCPLSFSLLFQVLLIGSLYMSRTLTLLSLFSVLALDLYAVKEDWNPPSVISRQEILETSEAVLAMPDILLKVQEDIFRIHVLDMDWGGSVTAFHPSHDNHELRIPEGARPFDSGILIEGDNPRARFEWIFEEEGTYDYYSRRQERLGAVGRIVVGSPGGPGEEPKEVQRSQRG